MAKAAQRTVENLCNIANPRRESARAFDQRRFVILRRRRIYRTGRKNYLMIPPHALRKRHWYIGGAANLFRERLRWKKANCVKR